MGSEAGLIEERKLPIWIAVVVAVGALLMIAGALLALLRPEMLLAPADEVTRGVRVYAGYLFSRNLVLGCLLVGALFGRFRASLPGFLVLYALIQFGDAIMDCVEGRWAIVPPVVVLGAVFVLVWVRLMRAESKVSARQEVASG